jgi:LAO/AO transport system kinase
VGQDEVEIARLADVTVVVLAPGQGDDVQAIKAGIMEIADVFVINKSDLAGAEKLEREIKGSLALSDHTPPPVVRTVASEGRGIAEAFAAIRAAHTREADPERAARIWSSRLREMLRERLLDTFTDAQFAAAGRDVAEHRRDPFSILREWTAAPRQ